MSDESQGRFGRRAFLHLAGTASVAAACSPKAVTQHLVPLAIPAENIVPGKPLYYRTVCRECSASCGVTARTREGRVVKLEGNPEDPVSGGALCARGQAALQALYHPDRFQGPARRDADGKLRGISWDDGEDALAKALVAARARGEGRIRLVSRLEPGSVGALQRAVLRSLGARPEDRIVYEPFDLAPLRAAGAALFGREELPAFDLAAARSVVAFGADFLETWLSPVEHARQLASGRGVVGERRTRVTWVGPRLALTGASADRWLRTRAGGELAVALGLLRWITDPANGVGHVAPEVRELAPRLARLEPSELARRAGVEWKEIARLGKELAERKPSALLGPGPASQGPDATNLAAVLLLLDVALGNVGRTVLFGVDPREDAPSSFGEVRRLVADMARGDVDVLLVHHADLLGSLPAALRAVEALKRVPLVVSFATRPDATTAQAHLVLPDHHTLESFGDATARRGAVNLAQPVMTPLADTRPASQVLLEVARRPPLEAAGLPSDLSAYLKARAEEHARASGKTGPTAALHREALQRGGWYHDAAGERLVPKLRPSVAERFVALPAASAERREGDLDLVFFPTALRGDGRAADLPWLQEIPDALSTVSWSPWAEIAPAVATRLGVATGDLLVITTASGNLEVPAYVFPGIRDDAVALPLGGPEAAALLSVSMDPRSGALALVGGTASVTRAGKSLRLPVLEGSPYQHGRSIVPTVSAAAPALPKPDSTAHMYDPPRHPEHRWAMAIDLDRCTGCQACVVACFAENNVPVMGREAAERGRYMGWIRIERYLGDEPGGDLDVRLMPMMCQQCSNAPCEPVCPVYATYHTSEGLSAQVYNRCVGTRYCSNNCPYKVRSFNWREPEFPRPLQMQLNPDVTVRSRGVMEKCTFCVQRIRYAENSARDDGRKVEDGEIVPACAQTCPAQAIVFGDANDPESRLNKAARSERGFGALAELGTGSAVTYLARVRDPESI